MALASRLSTTRYSVTRGIAINLRLDAVVSRRAGPACRRAAGITTSAGCFWGRARTPGLPPEQFRSVDQDVIDRIPSEARVEHEPVAIRFLRATDMAHGSNRIRARFDDGIVSSFVKAADREGPGERPRRVVGGGVAPPGMKALDAPTARPRTWDSVDDFRVINAIAGLASVCDVGQSRGHRVLAC